MKVGYRYGVVHNMIRISGCIIMHQKSEQVVEDYCLLLLLRLEILTKVARQLRKHLSAQSYHMLRSFVLAL